MTSGPSISRRTALAFGAAAALARPALAQGSFPDRPIRLIVPWTPGGSSDGQMRAIAESASRRLKQPVVVENKPGAAGTLGALTIKDAKADGYHLTQMPISVFRLPHMMERPNFNPLKDFTYIIHVTGYLFGVVVRADSPFQSLADLKGRRVAHTSATSNSGNLAPRAFFPQHGLVPDQDYRVIYSGGHDRSVMGVNAGDYDAAAVASDVFNRMVQRGQVRRENFRVIWESAPFPTSSFALAHDLRPELAQRIRQCFFDFRFPPQMSRDLGGNDRFWPATYLKDWEPVRQVADAVNAPYTRANFDIEARREEEAAARRAQQRQQQQQRPQ